MSYRIANARLVLQDRVVHGSVLVDTGGQIVAVDEGCGPGDVDLGGDLLIPGLIELHTDGLEHFLLPRPGAYWPERAALLAHDGAVATAGITTVLDAISAGMLDDDGPRARYFHTTFTAIETAVAETSLRVDHRLHIRCELPAANLMELVTPVIQHPLVKLVSLMDHTPGQRATTMASASAAREAGLSVIMGAPNLVRRGSNSGNVAAGEVARAGMLDILSSDYAPHSLLHGAWLLHAEHGMTLSAALATVTSTPAKILKMEDRGRIKQGLRADLVQVAHAEAEGRL